MPTPADELRTASAKLRAVAAAAANDSGSPHWEASRILPDHPESSMTRVSARPGGNLIHGHGPRHPSFVTGPVGDYIAAMDPAVGLALADWLQSEAELLANDDFPAIHAHALAVARQINAGQP